jgi:dTDP-4-dehydrorhamnose reductase
MNILVLGRDGQVGWELVRSMAPLGKVTATGRAELDLASDQAIRDAVRSVRPGLIVNAAAYTAVDRAESEPEPARRINVEAVATLADAAKAIDAAVIHYSTDYVFDGTKPEPYTELDLPHPLGVYGQTKLEGERALAAAGIPYLVLRTSWVYGARGRNFLLTILRLAKEKPELRIVDDQIGAPTWSRDIADATAAIARRWFGEGSDSDRLRKRSGVYHMTATGKTSWYGFAKRAIETEKAAGTFADRTYARLIPIPTAEYPTPAVRPRNSQLNCSHLAETFQCRLPEWQDSLARVMHEPGLGPVASQSIAGQERL